MMSNHKFSILPIIILNWNNFSDTEECVDSILNTGLKNYKIFLLDNGSEDSDVISIKEKYGNEKSIELVFFSKNLGFTKAHNQILLRIIEEGYKYVFMLNNDAVIKKESLEIILEYVNEGKIDMLSCKMVDYYSPSLMDNAGHRILSSGEIIPIGHKENVEKYNQPLFNIGSCAGAALYSVKMLEDIGLFDEYFETGYEDAELGFRAINSGYKSIYDPEIIVFHKMGRSIRKVFDYRYTLKTQSNIYYSYFKLAHWQLIVLGFLPWLIRFFMISLVHFIFWRPKYLKIQYHAFYEVFFKSPVYLMKARKKAKVYRRIKWWQSLLEHEFFLRRDIKNFYTFMIKGEKSFYEKY